MNICSRHAGDNEGQCGGEYHRKEVSKNNMSALVANSYSLDYSNTPHDANGGNNDTAIATPEMALDSLRVIA